MELTMCLKGVYTMLINNRISNNNSLCYGNRLILAIMAMIKLRRINFVGE